MIFLEDLWNLVTINAFAVCGVLGSPKGSTAELLDGSLMLLFFLQFIRSNFPSVLPGWK